jgi:hypothetical protein
MKAVSGPAVPAALSTGGALAHGRLGKFFGSSHLWIMLKGAAAFSFFVSRSLKNKIAAN